MMRLRDLDDCFEGVIPSIIATSDGDGVPNISYLSHVVRVDDTHVAISNQFFAKTAANLHTNPHASLLVVSARDGRQFRLDAAWVESRDDGPLFERISHQLKASSVQVGMAGIMRLKTVDIFRVDAVKAVAVPRAQDSQAEAVEGTMRAGTDRAMQESWGAAAVDYAALGHTMNAIGAQTEAEGVLDAVLDGCEAQGFQHVIVLLGDTARRLQTTVVSRGYDRPGAGSEVADGDGLIGMAAAGGRTVKINDMSRVRRLGAAIETTSPADENRTRTIALPSLPDALSQIAVPLVAQNVLRGVLFVESRQRLAFSSAHETALEMLASQCALALGLCEALAPDASQAVPSAHLPATAGGRTIQVVHHLFDDSVFIDHTYAIKGVAGRLLTFMLSLHIQEGRGEFTNREIRLADALKLPDIKDNLETRLLLLRRRLAEKSFPIQLVHAGRGRVRLVVDGMPVLSRVR